LRSVGGRATKGERMIGNIVDREGAIGRGEQIADAGFDAARPAAHAGKCYQTRRRSPVFWRSALPASSLKITHAALRWAFIRHLVEQNLAVDR
jgi:hypothetical protein